ncbi:conserved hypothetical protein [Beggiatoa sp. PS]|nr:conserved hypothetical protein [Beggiatoa sp. PS]
MHDVLTKLDQEKEELFKARGTKPLLNKTIRAYKEACKRIQDHSLSPNQWSEHAKRLDEAQQQHVQFTHQLQNYRAEQNRLERIQRTRPLLQRHQELKAELDTLLSIILLPDDAASKHFEAKLALRTAQSQEQQARQDIIDLQNHQAAIIIPQTLLAQKTTIDELRERLGSHLKAAHDLPGVRTEMRTVESEARTLLRRIYPQLDLPDVTTQLAITNSQRERLKKLAEIAPARHEKQHHIAKRLAELTEQLAQHCQALENLPASPDLNRLRAVLTRACQYGNLEELQLKDEHEVHQLTENTTITLKTMGWNGSLLDFEQVALPKMERIDSFERRFNELNIDRQRIKERLLEARQRNERSTQKINALSWAGDIPTEEALMKARQNRQKYWQHIKKLKVKGKTKSTQTEDNLSLFGQPNTSTTPAIPSLFEPANTLNFDEEKDNHSTSKNKMGTNELYQNFEETMLHVDELSDRLRREASRVAEYSILLAEQQSAQREQEQQTKKWHTVEALIAKVQTEWEESWKSVGMKPWTPGEMRTWLNDGLNLRQQANQLRERRQHLQERQTLIDTLCQELTQALTPLKFFLKGEILTHLSDLIGQGEVCVKEVTNLQRQRDNLQLEINNLIKEQQRTQAIQQQAHDALNQWQMDWTQALTPLHLPPDTPPETARNVLNDLDQVLNKIDKTNGLRRRVDLMQKDAEMFQRDVARLAQKIAPELVNEIAEQVVPELANRLNQAEKDLTRLEQLQHRLQAEQQRLTHIIQQVKSSQAHLQTLLEQAHCQDLAALEKAEQASSHKKNRTTRIGRS